MLQPHEVVAAGAAATPGTFFGVPVPRDSNSAGTEGFASAVVIPCAVFIPLTITHHSGPNIRNLRGRIPRQSLSAWFFCTRTGSKVGLRALNGMWSQALPRRKAVVR
ncbi:hypothetical protein BT67DRAFT_442899 [Trichocladium antarcticum]|uniref:Uncharacterized protein n=1 Tax=Trichocladium antarcticum TaxID=1450529 RepID=A0AAN6ZDH5_9PEZI|nr:hypothetical protein BT67DRAFT_442899 [Trichocladium antarcticum]